MKKSLITLASISCAAFSFSQSFVAVAVDNATDGIWLYDASNIHAAPTQVVGFAAWGMAANNDDQVLYVNNGGTLATYQYGSWLQTGTIALTFNGAGINFVGLAYDDTNNKLYGLRNIATEALYEIDPTTGFATQGALYIAGDYDWGGFDWNATNGLFYGTNDDVSPFGNGLFSFDTTMATINMVAPYPSGETDLDGLAVGNDKAFIIEDDSVAANGTMYVYDLIANAYVDTVALPWTGSRTFAAGAFITMGAQNTISGRIILNNFVGTVAGRTATIEIIQGGNVVDTQVAVLDALGNYSVTTTATGTVDVAAKSSHWLRALVSGVSVGSSGISFALVNGDSDDDNEVGPGDFALMTPAFGSNLGDSNYTDASDLDGDEEVGPSDFSIISANFGQSGD